MSRPVTLFTGQWADLPLGTPGRLARKMGYDGLALTCWGDHFDVDAAAGAHGYLKKKSELLMDQGLSCHAISSHLVGQTACDPIDVSFGDAPRYWDFRSLGHGDIKFEDIIVALNDVGYRGPLSVEWEDIRMDRIFGATEVAAFLRRLDFTPSSAAFDAAFTSQ